MNAKVISLHGECAKCKEHDTVKFPALSDSEKSKKLKAIIAKDARIVRRIFAELKNQIPKGHSQTFDEDIIGWLRHMPKYIRGVYENNEPRFSLANEIAEIYEYIAKKKLDDKRLKNFIKEYDLFQYNKHLIGKVKEAIKPECVRTFIGGLMCTYDELCKDKLGVKLDNKLFFEVYRKWMTDLESEGVELKLVKRRT